MPVLYVPDYDLGDHIVLQTVQVHVRGIIKPHLGAPYTLLVWGIHSSLMYLSGTSDTSGHQSSM